MNKQPLLLALSLVALPLVAAGTRPVDAVAFHPEEGLALKKTFSQRFEQELDDLAVTVNGDEQEIDEVPDVSTTSVEKVVVVDRYRKVGDGRPTVLARELAELGGTKNQSQDGEETEEDTSSELEGAVVVFTWDADEEAYALAIEDGDFDADYLDELEEDMDLRGFLPPDDVDEGDTWAVDIQAFVRLLSPGGDLRIVGPDGRDENDREISRQIDDNMEGDLEAEYQGTREVDGVSLAIVAVTGSTQSTAEHSVENDMGEISRTVDVGMEVEMELLWDVAAGHFASVEMSADVDVEVLEKQHLSFEEQTLDIEQEISFTGELTVNGSAERTE